MMPYRFRATEFAALDEESATTELTRYGLERTVANNSLFTEQFRGPTIMKKLKPELGSLELFAFGFGSIVGIAWVVLMGQLLAQAGLFGVGLGLSIGAIMMMLIGVCYAELGAALPLAGGEVAYANQLYGRRFAGLVGWFLLLSCVLVCGFEMISVGWILTELWPALARTRLYMIRGQEVFLEPLAGSVLIHLLIVTVNYLGARGAGRLQAFTTGGKLLLSACFIVAGFLSAKSTNSKPFFVANDVGAILPGVISVVTIAPFWFSGFNSISQALGERAGSVSPKRAANMIIVSLAAAWAFYVLVLFSMALTMPRQELLNHALPTAAAFQAAFHSLRIGNVVLFAGLLGLVSTWNALFFSATRILFVLAEQGFLSSALRRVQPRFGTPSSAIAAVGILIPTVAFFGKGLIGPLLSSFSIVMAAIYGLMCVGVLRLRKRAHVGLRLTVSRRLLPYAALIACLLIEAFAWLDPIRDVRGGHLPVPWTLLVAWGGLGVWLTRRADWMPHALRPL